MADKGQSFASNYTDKQPYQHLRFPVVILGAGVSGIATACLLKKKLGLSDFRIFDRQGGIGGAWWINKYPGVACDIPALFYSYSFAPNYEWTSLFPPGDEIQQYLENVCEQQQIRGNIQLNTEISEARWLEDEAEWEIHMTTLAPFAGDLSEADRRERVRTNGERGIYIGKSTIRTKIFISCAGELVEPNSWPRDVPGLELFKGSVFHSARWKADIDLNNKDIVVVGTGCTSAQLVPSLMKEPYAPKSVTQLMRTPPWVIPRQQTPRSWKKYASLIFRLVPLLALCLRYMLFLYSESTWLNIGMSRFNKWGRKRYERKLLLHIQKAVPEKYLAMLTPSFGVGCRRVIVDDGWLESLNLSNVELTTRPLDSVNERNVVLGPEPSISSSTTNNVGGRVTKPADVIILANGFETSTYLHRVKVRGTNGKYLHDVWNERGGPSAYLSTAIHGFPNFFMILGPNAVSGHSSAMLASENVANYALQLISLVLKGKAQTVEIKERAERDYTAEVQRRSIDKVWQTCRNGYISSNGWNSSICPFSQIHFSLKCMFPQWKDWDMQGISSGKSSGLWDILYACTMAIFVMCFIFYFVRSHSSVA